MKIKVALIDVERLIISLHGRAKWVAGEHQDYFEANECRRLATEIKMQIILRKGVDKGG